MFRKLSRDALFQRPLPPSFSAGASQFQNLGKVENRGYEVSIDASILRRQLMTWDVRVNGSHIKNRLVTVGDVVLGTTPGARNVVGYPINGLWDRAIIRYADANGDGMLVESEIAVTDTQTFRGPSLPEYEAGFMNNVGLFNGALRLIDAVRLPREVLQQLGPQNQRCVSTGNCRAVNDPTTPLEDQAAAVMGASSTARTQWGFFAPNDFIRFREASVSYHVPVRFTERYLRGRQTSIVVSGRNLGLIKNRFPGTDPEANSQAGSSSETSPPSRRCATSSAASTWRSNHARIHEDSYNETTTSAPITAVFISLAFTACSREQLLEVETPDQITPASTASASGAQAQWVAAIGLFTRFFAAGDGSTGIGINVATAILGDEAFVARSGSEHLDSRAQDPSTFPANAPWTPFSDAHSGIVRAKRAMKAFPRPTRRRRDPDRSAPYAAWVRLYPARRSVLQRHSDLERHRRRAVDNNVQHGGPVREGASVYDSALATLSASSGDQVFRNAARVGKARTYVDLNQYDRAAQLVALVATGRVGRRADSVRLQRRILEYDNAQHQLGIQLVPVHEEFRRRRTKRVSTDSTTSSARDPRVAVDGTRLGPGQNGTLTPFFNQFPESELRRSTLASGIEARLIEAENSLKTG